MTAGCIYLDESGDLGWSFGAPYLKGGSSRFLCIAAVVVPSEKRHLPKRLIKHLYNRNRWSPTIETKWANMTAPERLDFAERAAALLEAEPEIKLLGIVVKKEKVLPHIRTDSNKLYNYMIRLLLADHLRTLDHATIIPDARTIKVESGNSLHDYLQIHLWFEVGAKTDLVTRPSDSSKTLNLQFADMLAGVLSSRYERGVNDYWKPLSKVFVVEELYFRLHNALDARVANSA